MGEIIGPVLILLGSLLSWIGAASKAPPAEPPAMEAPLRAPDAEIHER